MIDDNAQHSHMDGVIKGDSCIDDGELDLELEPAQNRARLTVKDASYVVNTRKMGRVVATKEILHGVDFTVHSPEILAIMGPSGSGKTTLLDLLTFGGTGGKRTGTVELNGEFMTRKIFRERCVYVPQIDSGWWCLTCGETIDFAAHFVMKGTSADRQRRVDEVLKRTGLESCKDTQIGNEFVKGLSGGQRRRLSLAVGLLGKPMVIFLDEVTSGLDATAAASVISFLTQLTRTEGVAAVCTIHQPSGLIFQKFDKLLLLSEGYTAYYGSASGAISYFESLGRKLPPLHNPADFLLEQVNKDFVDAALVNEALESWRNTKNDLNKQLSQADLYKTFSETGTKNCFSQFRLLLKRQVFIALRDPAVYIGRIGINILCCCFFAFVYIKSRDRTQEQVLNRYWLIAWILAFPSLMAMTYSATAYTEFYAVKREVQCNMYSFWNFVLAQTIIQIPLMLVLAIAALGPAGYGIGNWSISAFGQMTAIMAVFLWTYECIAQFCAVVAPHPAVSSMGTLSCWIIFFLFCGALIRAEDVPWPLRLFVHLSPCAHAGKAAVYLEFIDQDYEGATVLSDGRFICPIFPCYGRTGYQVLGSLSNIMYNVSNKDEFWKDIGIVCAIGAFFKLFYVIIATTRCLGGPTLERAN